MESACSGRRGAAGQAGPKPRQPPAAGLKCCLHCCSARRCRAECGPAPSHPHQVRLGDDLRMHAAKGALRECGAQLAAAQRRRELARCRHPGRHCPGKYCHRVDGLPGVGRLNGHGNHRGACKGGGARMPPGSAVRGTQRYPRAAATARAWCHAPHSLLISELGCRIEVLLRLDAQAREREEERGGRARGVAACRRPACRQQPAGAGERGERLLGPRVRYSLQGRPKVGPGRPGKVGLSSGTGGGGGSSCAAWIWLEPFSSKQGESRGGGGRRPQLDPPGTTSGSERTHRSSSSGWADVAATTAAGGSWATT